MPRINSRITLSFLSVAQLTSTFLPRTLSIEFGAVVAIATVPEQNLAVKITEGDYFIALRSHRYFAFPGSQISIGSFVKTTRRANFQYRYGRLRAAIFLRSVAPAGIPGNATADAVLLRRQITSQNCTGIRVRDLLLDKMLAFRPAISDSVLTNGGIDFRSFSPRLKSTASAQGIRSSSWRYIKVSADFHLVSYE